MDQAGVSDAVLEFGATAQRVLILRGEEQIDCHIAGLGMGFVNVVAATDLGRVERKIPLTEITDIAAFYDDDDIEPEPEVDDDDPIEQMRRVSSKLREAAGASEQMGIAIGEATRAVGKLGAAMQPPPDDDVEMNGYEIMGDKIALGFRRPKS